MATSKEFLDYLIDKIKMNDTITIKPMMGEYLIYYKGKLIGDICDNSLLLKRCKATDKMLQGASLQYPYVGSKQLMYVVDIDEFTMFQELFDAMCLELPERKVR